MNLAVCFAICTSCIIASTAAPARQVESWMELQDKFSSILELVHSTGRQAMDIASKDKPSIGAMIERQLDAAAEKAIPILHQSRRAIEDMSFTWEQANQVLTALKKLLYQNLDYMLSRLSSIAENQIRNIFNRAYDLFEEKKKDFQIHLLVLDMLAAE